MRIAVLSDIHGNCVALDQVLADLERHPVDQLVCLGDAIQGGHQPVQTVARLRELGCPIVLGNADAWLLSGVNTSDHETVTARQEVVREWSLAQLSEADRAFIAAFMPTVELALEGGCTLLCFHGSPTSFDDLIFPETPQDEFARLLQPFAPAIFTGGHTHVPHVRRLGETFFFNPGSVGVAYDRHQPEAEDGTTRLDSWAEYAVLTSEDERLAVEFRRVPLAVGSLIAGIRASGHPYAEAMIAEYRSDER